MHTLVSWVHHHQWANDDSVSTVAWVKICLVITSSQWKIRKQQAGLFFPSVNFRILKAVAATAAVEPILQKQASLTALSSILHHFSGLRILHTVKVGKVGDFRVF